MLTQRKTLSLASIAAQPNWSAGLRLDSELVRTCAGAPGTALGAVSLTAGNRR